MSNHSESKIINHSVGNCEKRGFSEGSPNLAALCLKSDGLLLAGVDFEELLDDDPILAFQSGKKEINVMENVEMVHWKEKAKKVFHI